MYTQRKIRRNASGLRLVGAQLALFRKASGLTQRELGERVSLDEETVASIEQGRRPLKSDLADELDRLLGTKGALSVALENLPERERFPVWAADYMDLEREAIAISWYENHLVPGVLQTEAYARALFGCRVPYLDEDEIERRVNDRLERQELLRRTPPMVLSFVVSQTVLMERLGGDEVYARQLDHLRACADLPGLMLQVMPFGRHTHTGLAGPFLVLETTENDLIGYVESQRGSQLFCEPDEVSILSQKYAMLRTQALNTEETTALLEQLRGEL